MALDAQYMEILNRQEKILIIQTAFIGDAVLTLPMIQQLKKSNPDKLIDVVAAPRSREIFENSDAVNKVIIYDKHGKDKSVISLFRLARQLKAEKYSVIYAPHRSFRTALLVFLTEVRQTYGFSNSSFSYVYKYLIPYDPSSHEVKRNLVLAGIELADEEWRILPEIKGNRSIEEKISNFLPGSQRYAAVAPGSVWYTKRYPAEYFKEIIRFLISSGFTVIITGGSSDQKYCDEIAQDFPEGRIINTAGEFSIRESIEILKHCDLLVSNDSAPTHFGMCARIPVVTIYCSTIPEFGFYPYYEKSEIINYTHLKCKPCGIHGHQACPLGTFDCAHKIDINNIKSALNRIISK